MNALAGLLALLITASTWAGPEAPLDTKNLEKDWDSHRELLNRSDVRPQVELIKTTLNIGSDEELITIVKSVNPEIIKKVAELNIKLTDKQVKDLEALAMDNKAALVGALLTGSVPKGLIKKASAIVPELEKLDEKTKEEVFKTASTTANKLVFDRLAKAELILGYQVAQTGNNAVAQLNTRLLNLRKISIGGIEIEDVHLKITLGYPQNGITILSGKVKAKDSALSFEGELLGFTYDVSNSLLDFTIAKARINYNILPWLQGYAGLGLGVRSYTDGTVFAIDPTAGIRAEGKKGPLRAEAFVEGTYRISENNFTASCGGSVGLEVLNTDLIQMQTGILTKFTVETNPREGGNRWESFNGIGVSGHF